MLEPQIHQFQALFQFPCSQPGMQRILLEECGALPRFAQQAKQHFRCFSPHSLQLKYQIAEVLCTWDLQTPSPLVQAPTRTHCNTSSISFREGKFAEILQKVCNKRLGWVRIWSWLVPYCKLRRLQMQGWIDNLPLNENQNGGFASTQASPAGYSIT